MSEHMAILVQHFESFDQTMSDVQQLFPALLGVSASIINFIELVRSMFCLIS